MQISTGILRLSSIALLSIALANCAYIIPPEENPPRNNTVLGEKRKPQLNVPIIGPQSMISQGERTMKAVPTETNITAADLPPVGEATSAPAEKQMVSAMPGGQVPEFAPVVAAQAPRYIPVENQQMGVVAAQPQGFQVASSEYPPINSIPDRPQMSGPGSAESRLSTTRTVLEKDRTSAIDTRNALARDAAAEPTITPYAAPATVAPLPVPVDPNAARVPALNQARPPEASVPPTMQTASLEPLPLQPAPSAAPIQLASLTPPAKAPIILRRPVPPAEEAPQANPNSFDPMTVGMSVSPAAIAEPAPGAMAFNPLTTAEPAYDAPVATKVVPLSNTATASYLSPSRYAASRR